MGEINQAVYFQIPGVGPVLPEVGLIGKSLLQRAVYAQENSLKVYGGPQINKVAKFTRPESPQSKWAKAQAAALKGKVSAPKDYVEEGYAKLRGDVWERCWVEGDEILALPPYSKRLVAVEGMQNISDQPVLITGYRIEGSPESDFIIKGGRARALKNFPRTSQEASKKSARELGALFPTYIRTNPDVNFREGLRTLPWNFGLLADERRVGLHSYWDPWYSDSDVGSLLGRLDSEVSQAAVKENPALPTLTPEDLKTIRAAYEIFERFVPKQ